MYDFYETRLTKSSVRMNMIMCRFHDLNDTNLKIISSLELHSSSLQGYLVTHIDQPDDILWGGFGYSLHEDTRLTSSDQLSSLSGFNRLPMSVQKMNPPLQSNKPYGPVEVLRWIAVTSSRCISSPCFYNKRSCLNNIRKNLPVEYGLFESDTMLTVPDNKLFEFDTMMMVPDMLIRWDEKIWNDNE